jgi:hypothetical protein
VDKWPDDMGRNQNDSYKNNIINFIKKTFFFFTSTTPDYHGMLASSSNLKT